MPDREQLNAGGSFLEEFGGRANTHENDGAALEPVNQQEIAADMALAVINQSPLSG